MLTEKVLFNNKECKSIIELAGEWVDSGLYYQGKNKIDELSIGMSDDYEKALQFNPTYIRLGTILFGKRS